MTKSAKADLSSPPTRRRPQAARAFVSLGAVLLAGLLTGCERLEFEQVADGQIDAARKTHAEQFGTAMLGAWARDEYPPLGDDAAEEMRAGHDAESQKKADKQLEADIGSFKSLAFHELQRTKPAKFDVYRFKATFDKSKDQVEVRVVYDVAGKVTGLWVKPWKDSL